MIVALCKYDATRSMEGDIVVVGSTREAPPEGGRGADAVLATLDERIRATHEARGRVAPLSEVLDGAYRRAMAEYEKHCTGALRAARIEGGGDAAASRDVSASLADEIAAAAHAEAPGAPNACSKRDAAKRAWSSQRARSLALAAVDCERRAAAAHLESLSHSRKAWADHVRAQREFCAGIRSEWERACAEAREDFGRRTARVRKSLDAACRALTVRCKERTAYYTAVAKRVSGGKSGVIEALARSHECDGGESCRGFAAALDGVMVETRGGGSGGDALRAVAAQRRAADATLRVQESKLPVGIPDMKRVVKAHEETEAAVRTAAAGADALRALEHAMKVRKTVRSATGRGASQVVPLGLSGGAAGAAMVLRDLDRTRRAYASARDAVETTAHARLLRALEAADRSARAQVSRCTRALVGTCTEKVAAHREKARASMAKWRDARARLESEMRSRGENCAEYYERLDGLHAGTAAAARKIDASAAAHLEALLRAESRGATASSARAIKT